MKLVLDITTESQKADIIQLAEQLHIPVEVLETTEEEEDAALARAIYATAKGDYLSANEKTKFIDSLIN